MHKKYKDDIDLFGINLSNRDDIQDVKDYVEQYAIEYPVLLDDTGDIYKKYGGAGFPALYFFNSDGVIVDQIIGSTDIETIEDSFKLVAKMF